MGDFSVAVEMLLETYCKFELEYDGELWQVRLYDGDHGCIAAKGKKFTAAMRNLRRLIKKVG